jgi:hypothetical protein
MVVSRLLGCPYGVSWSSATHTPETSRWTTIWVAEAQVMKPYLHVPSRPLGKPSKPACGTVMFPPVPYPLMNAPPACCLCSHVRCSPLTNRGKRLLMRLSRSLRCCCKLWMSSRLASGKTVELMQEGHSCGDWALKQTGQQLLLWPPIVLGAGQTGWSCSCCVCCTCVFSGEELQRQ